MLTNDQIHLFDLVHRFSGSGIWETLSGYTTIYEKVKSELQNFPNYRVLSKTQSGSLEKTFTARETDYPDIVIIDIHIRLPQIHMKGEYEVRDLSNP